MPCLPWGCLSFTTEGGNNVADSEGVDKENSTGLLQTNWDTDAMYRDPAPVQSLTKFKPTTALLQSPGGQVLRTLTAMTRTAVSLALIIIITFLYYLLRHGHKSWYLLLHDYKVLCRICWQCGCISRVFPWLKLGLPLFCRQLYNFASKILYVKSSALLLVHVSRRKFRHFDETLPLPVTLGLTLHPLFDLVSAFRLDDRSTSKTMSVLL